MKPVGPILKGKPKYLATSNADTSLTTNKAIAGTIASSMSFTSILENIGRINYDDTVEELAMSNISLYDNIYKKITPLLFKVLIFFTPLIFVMGTNEIFEFPKTYFVYIIGLTIICLFLIQKVLTDRKIKAPNIYITLFVAIYIISTLFSTHLYTSIWGYYTRFNGGLFSILILLGIYVVLDNEFKRRDIIKLVSVGSVAVLPIGIYAILQHFGVSAQIWKGDPTIRAFSTLGQPNWLAAYLAMYLPFILGNIINVSKNEDLLIDNKLFNIVLFLIGFSALWFTYSLSGLLGGIVGLVYFTVLNFKKILSNFKYIAFIGIVSLLIAISSPGIFDEKVKDILVDFKKVTSGITKVYAAEEPLENSISDPGYIRNYLWTGTLSLVNSSVKNLVIGTGPETFPYEFQKFRPKELNDSSEWNLVFNKPHNYYLEVLANIGVLGLITYLTILLTTIKSGDKIFLPGLVALYVTNIFSWPTISTALLFWIFLKGTQKDD